MKGDFSRWRFRALDNLNGVLHQQGRVLTDVDFTDAERIDLHWQVTAARDIIGALVAAVPSTEADGFRIESAHVDNTGGSESVVVEVHPGRVWADGLLAYLAGATDASTAPVSRVATYFGPPVQDPASTPADIGDGIRDAVILELAHEELNAFQWPDRLLEPALGDLDTTERIQTSFAFRLYRLGPNETCRSIIDGIQDGPAGKGRLTVTLEQSAVIPGDCPVPLGGGYTGFEHNLYRIEIADTEPGAGAYFKWSQFNGGLVGRGTFRAATHRCEIHGNRAAILNSNLTGFYLEAVQLDPDTGRWNVVFGTDATLNAQNELALTDPPFFGDFPAGDQEVFFRLWNGIEQVASYTNPANPPFRDGIELVFDAPTATNYRPGDYWTFQVRVGQTAVDPLVDDEPPHGVFYHRVALAEIEWTDDQDTTVSGEVVDCRVRFRPLTNQNVCCTLLVGDGIQTFGDFNSVEEAAAHLPEEGGELCLLPGIHTANLSLTGRRKITIHGCPKRSLVFPRIATKTSPIFEFVDCTEMRIEGLDLVSFDGIPIHVRSTGAEPAATRDVVVENCRILGCHENVIRVDRARDLVIARNVIWQLDKTEAGAAISFEADRVLVERNTLGVIPAGSEPVPPEGPDGEDPANPSDPCADSDSYYGNPNMVVGYVYGIWMTGFLELPPNPYTALGGIHVRPGSEEVRIVDNKILGGAGNGITLGGELIERDRPAEQPGAGDDQRVTLTLSGSVAAVVMDADEAPRGDILFTLTNVATGQARTALSEDDGALRFLNVPPGTYQLSAQPEVRIVSVEQAENVYVITVDTGAADGTTSSRLAQLYRIEIVENEISLMGLSGVGFGVHPPIPMAQTGRDFSDLAALNPGIPASFNVGEAVLGMLTPDDLLSVSNVVRDLVVRNNRIHRNLLNPFTAEMLEDARRFARGGISLGVCSEVAIAENHILDNGPTAVDPVCGVFIGYGEDLDVADNVIVNNGALPGGTPELQRGIRGGIVVRLAAGGGLDTAAIGKPALRVHDNRVDQPAGRALAAICFGPVLCSDNYFNSERMGRSTFLDLLVGGVLLANFGGLHRYMRGKGGYKSGYLGSMGYAGYTGGSLTHMSEYAGYTDRYPGYDRWAALETVLPGGETLVSNNHVRCGPEHQSLSSIGIATLDDLCFDGNQSSILQTRLLLANAVLWAYTVRVTDNRFSELAPEPTWSLWSRGVSNVTTHNQADHCIIAQPTTAPRNIVAPNVVLNPSHCGRFAEGFGVWLYVAEVAIQALGGQSDVDITGPAGAIAVPNHAYVQNHASNAYAAYAGGRETWTYAMRSEQRRVAAKYGAGSQRARDLERTVARSRALTDEVRNLSEAGRAPKVDVSEREAAISGRVVDPRKRGQGSLTVELVRPDGTPIGRSGKTDAVGNFAFKIAEDETTRLEKEGPVFVRVRDEKGETMSTSEPLAIAPSGVVAAELVVPARVIGPADLSGAKTIFGARGPARERRGPEAEPSGREGRPTPLVEVRGLGPVRIETLRKAGIHDVETLLRSDVARTARLVGMDRDTLKKNAEEALKKEPPGKRR